MGHDVVDGGSASWYNSGHEREVREYARARWNLDQLYSGVFVWRVAYRKHTLHSVPSNIFHHRGHPDHGPSRRYDYVWSQRTGYDAADGIDHGSHGKPNGNRDGGSNSYGR